MPYLRECYYPLQSRERLCGVTCISLSSRVAALVASAVVRALARTLTSRRAERLPDLPQSR